MKIKIKKLSALLVLFAFCLTAVYVFDVQNALAQQQSKSTIIQQMRDTIKASQLSLKGLNAEPELVLSNIITGVLGFLGIIFLLLTVYGGFLWMTARGNDEQVTKARNIIISSGIGIVIIVGAYIITVVVIEILQSSIPTS